MSEVGITDGNHYAFAIDTDWNTIVAMCTLRTDRRGMNCDNCTQVCGEGFIAWVKQGYRGNNIIKELHAFLREKTGVVRPLYIGPADRVKPSVAQVFWSQGLTLPAGFEYDPTASQTNNEQLTYEYVQRLSPLFGWSTGGN